MKYNNRSFPHPVLNLGDDIQGDFGVKLQVETNKDIISILPVFHLKNDSIEELIRNKQAAFVVQLYCRGTMFRKAYSTYEHIPDPIKIESIKLNQQVETDFFVCATEDIIEYKNEGFTEDFGDYSFSIEQGDILAIGGTGKFYANKSPEELKAVSSFMNIDSSGKKGTHMLNYYDGRKITILLSQEDYEMYQLVIRNKYYIDTLHSTIALPALAEAIHFLDTEESKMYSEYMWYDLLTDLINEFNEVDPLVTAQRILDLPVNRSLKSLIELMDQPEVL